MYSLPLARIQVAGDPSLAEGFAAIVRDIGCDFACILFLILSLRKSHTEEQLEKATPKNDSK